MIAAAIRFEIRIPDVASLKGKRAVLRPIIDGLRRKVSVSVSEVGHQNSWQRSVVGVALVAPDPGSMESLIDRVRRYVDDHMEIEVLDCEVTYLETGG